jgi:hypothetical protein
MAGNWGGSPPPAVLAVISRVRDVSLANVRLLSDRQPQRLRIDQHSSSPPAIWLHADPPETAWIIVNIGSRDWSKLAYQFGHELGHVLCNSWTPDAKPQLPTQWVEESLAEAFSLRGLGLLADSWEQNPPFPNDAAFAAAIRRYRQDLIDKYDRQCASCDFVASWQQDRTRLETGGIKWSLPAILAVLRWIEADRACVEDLGALNRWPQRSAIPLPNYLQAWRESCRQIGAVGHLPERLSVACGCSPA